MSILNRLSLGLTAVLVAAAASPSPAFAVNMTAEQVVALGARQEGHVAFKGTRSQQVTRQDQVYHADAKVDFRDLQDYQIALTQPKEINGLNLALENNKLTCYFPGEALVFQSDLGAAGDEVRELVMGKLTDDPNLLLANYNVTVAPEMDNVALYACYKLTLVPKHGLGPGSPPGHRFWIAQENGLVMKEERYWSDEVPAYFISQYHDLSTSRAPVIKVEVPANASHLRLASGTPTNMQRFMSPEAARAAGKTVYMPTVLPVGFRLRAIDVMSIYGTDIVLLRYNDGVSNMVVTYRAKQLSFVALLAGASALNLVNKISTLSYHAPNNYAIAEKGDKLIYGYGDLYQETLQASAASVPLPASKPGHAAALTASRALR